MKQVPLEFLAYHLDKAKRLQKTGQIFFLGPGAFLSGNTSIIASIIQSFWEKYPDHPVLKASSENFSEVTRILTCLLPYEREELLTDLNKKLQINDIYKCLAQLMSLGFVDYILTVNFDNLILRALVSEGLFPSIYDFSVVQNATFSFRKGSVIFLHRFLQRAWIPQKFEGKDVFFRTFQRLCDTIKGERMWVFLGFQGDEAIFEYFPGLTIFNNGLFWICERKNFCGAEKLDFLSESGEHFFLIQVEDTGSCMRTLSRLLDIPLRKDRKPFNDQEAEGFLINYVHPESENLGYLGGSPEANPPKNRHLAENKHDVPIGNERITPDGNNLSKAFTEQIVENPFRTQEITEGHSFEDEIIHKLDPSDLQLLCRVYNYWGIRIMRQALLDKMENAQKLFKEAVDKFHKASILCPQNHISYFNWGVLLYNMGRKISGKDTVHWYLEAMEKFKKSLELRPDFYRAYNEFAMTIISLADLKEFKEALPLYQEAMNKLRKAIDLNPQFLQASKNMEIIKDKLARIKNKEKYVISREIIKMFSDSEKQENGNNLHEHPEESAIPFSPESRRTPNGKGTDVGQKRNLDCSELSDNILNYPRNCNNKGNDYDANSSNLYLETIEKLKRAVKSRPGFYTGFNCLGLYYVKLAKTESGVECEKMFHQAFEYYKTATEINNRFFEAYFNWGCALTDLAYVKKNDKLILEAVDKFRVAEELNPQSFYTYSYDENELIYIEEAKSNRTYEPPVNSGTSKYSLKVNDTFEKSTSTWKAFFLSFSSKIYRIKKSALRFLLRINCGANRQEKTSCMEDASVGDKAFTDSVPNELKKNSDTVNGSLKSYGNAWEDKAMAYYNLGSYLGRLARNCVGPEAEDFYRQAFENLQKSYELNGRCYNLACLHAIIGNEKEALFFLEKSLSRNEVKIENVKKDKDWASFLERKDFNDILRKFKKL